MKVRAAGFSIDTAIPIPVELPAEDCTAAQGLAALENLTIEMIIAGMIRMICRFTQENKGENGISAYYRRFVLAFKPDILAEFKNAALVHLKTGSYGTAREIITALNGLFPGSDEVVMLEAALAEASAARVDKDYSAAYRLISGGKEESGMKRLRKFLERNPDSWNGWFMLGWALRRLKRWKDAIACFRKAAEAGGGCADTYNELAICLMETGDHDAARRELEKALSLDGENTKIISNMAILAQKTGRETEAKALFRKVP
ncbi:MAG: tetratricopeptide repeat protein [Spirochaetaceae bacterium]|nr:tetratricopeptide repeat protein [Spirochaetaceae bacterium]